MGKAHHKPDYGITTVDPKYAWFCEQVARYGAAVHGRIEKAWDAIQSRRRGFTVIGGKGSRTSRRLGFQRDALVCHVAWNRDHLYRQVVHIWRRKSYFSSAYLAFGPEIQHFLCDRPAEGPSRTTRLAVRFNVDRAIMRRIEKLSGAEPSTEWQTHTRIMGFDVDRRLVVFCGSDGAVYAIRFNGSRWVHINLAQPALQSWTPKGRLLRGREAVQRVLWEESLSILNQAVGSY